MPKKTKILLATIGGDCPGLNAVIRGIVLAAADCSFELVGGEYGLESILEDRMPKPIAASAVRDILPRSGSVLGSSNRCDPYRWEGNDAHGLFLKRLKDWEIAGIVAVGGEGTLDIVGKLRAEGVQILFIPKTIDNDIPLGGDAIGFWSAVEKVVEECDTLRATGESHHRAMVVEVMGRSSGYLALYAGIASGADAIVLPEIPADFSALVVHLKNKKISSYLVVLAEGADASGTAIPELTRAFADIASVRLTRLGYTQRGAPPRAWDRLYGSLFAAHAVELLQHGVWNRFVTHAGARVIDLPLDGAETRARSISRDDPMLRYARRLGIFFGDEK